MTNPQANRNHALHSMVQEMIVDAAIISEEPAAKASHMYHEYELRIPLDHASF